MKHPFALIMTYKSLEGHEYAIDWLPRESATDRAASLERLNDADVVAWMSSEQVASVTALLSEAGGEEALDLVVDETNYPLYIIANAGAAESSGKAALQLEETFAEINTEAFNETALCDGGPNRRETLKHAREAFRQIGSISEVLSALPTLLETLQTRLDVLEGRTPSPVVETPSTSDGSSVLENVETPSAETPLAETLSSETLPVAETDADAPIEESDTPIASVIVESPLDEEGNASSLAVHEEEPVISASSATPLEDAPPVLSSAARSSLRRLSNGIKYSGIKL